MNDFSRILLALDLEPELKEKARQNQSLGGQGKGSSNLTEAARLDVRNAIAKIAGVSVGNITKVKQVLAAAPPNIISALRGRELSIHRAWSWCKLSAENQENLLWEHEEHTAEPPESTCRTKECEQGVGGHETAADGKAFTPSGLRTSGPSAKRS